jgi:hypothetical protein
MIVEDLFQYYRLTFCFLLLFFFSLSPFFLCSIDAVAETSAVDLRAMTKACTDRFASDPLRDRLAVIQFNRGVVPPMQGMSRSSRGGLVQCCILCGRSNRALFRDPTLIVLQFIVPFVLGVAFGFVYRGITNDLKGIQNIAGSFFALQVFWCLVGTTALDAWNSHRQVVYRQLSAGYYGVRKSSMYLDGSSIIYITHLPRSLSY